MIPNPVTELSLTDEQLKTITKFVEEVNKAIQILADSIRSFLMTLEDLFHCGNNRQRYLAFYHKKSRVRKKNMNRLIKMNC